MNEPLETLLPKEAATCEHCGDAFDAAYVEHPFRPGEILTKQRACPKCYAAHLEAQQAKSAPLDEELARLRREAKWAELCPSLYRLESEGGLTDLDRLLRAQPAIEKVPARPYGAKGLLIRGKSDVGKTRIMWRLLRKHFDSGRGVIAYTSGSFERASRDAAGNFTLTEWFNRLCAVDCLFFDDLGKVSWSKTTTATFFDLVEHRTSNLKPLFITTNLAGDTLLTVLQVDKDLGAPLLQRLREHCDVLVL